MREYNCLILFSNIVPVQLLTLVFIFSRFRGFFRGLIVVTPPPTCGKLEQLFLLTTTPVSVGLILALMLTGVLPRIILG